MSSEISLHAMYAIANTPVNVYPFTHIIVDDFFPWEFYDLLRSSLPALNEYTSLVDTGRVGKGYNSERFVWMPKEPGPGEPRSKEDEFVRSAFRSLLTEEFAHLLLSIFTDDILARNLDNGDDTGSGPDILLETFLIRDRANYSLGPHTDSPKKLISCLLYLPPDDSHLELGTSIYLPKDRAFTCPGGPHHKFEDFEHVSTIPYRPNRFVAFPKTNAGFHGVEKVDGKDRVRDIWFIDLKLP